MNHTRRGTVRVLVLVLVFIAGFAFTSTASARTEVFLSMATSADENAPIPFSYTAHGLHGKKLVAQRAIGTHHVWTTVARLGKSSSGSSAVPGLPLGSYPIRLAALGKHKRVKAQSGTTVNVFGQVPFSSLFRGDSGFPFFYGGFVSRGSYDAGSFTFSYVYHSDVPNPEDGASEIVGVDPAHSFCRSIHFDYVPDDQGSVSLRLVQESQDPISGSGGPNTRDALNAALVPGQSWSLNAVASPNYGEIYVNGYASCDSTHRLFDQD